MKIFVFLVISNTTLAQVCSKDIKIFGEAASYENINGKIKKVSKLYRLPEKLSEHRGDFEKLIVESENKLKKIKVFNKSFFLEPINEQYQAKGLDFSKSLRESHYVGIFYIEIFDANGFYCKKSYEVIAGD